MAIKRRERPALDSAAIDSFGEAADATPERPAAPAAPSTPPADTDEGALQPARPPADPAQTQRPKAATVRANEWPEGLSKTFLLRYPDPMIPADIEQLAELVGRNKHQTTLLALRRGIEVLRREAEQLGNNAELLR